MFEVYKDCGKIVSFHGWEMPVQFSGIMDEHEAVRKTAGLFDVSHMGQIEISGPDALSFLQKITTNDVSALNIGDAQYSVMCYPSGGTVDDLLVYRLDIEKYLLVVNASNIEKDEAWLHENYIGEVTIRNCSDEIVLLAIQGPRAQGILQRLVTENLSTLQPFQFFQNVHIEGVPVLVSRTGYTGEDGFELYFHKKAAIAIWNLLLKEGKEDGLIPCGLGARDTLRLEAKLCLYGQELSPEISPIEAGVGFVVRMNKEAFVGKEILLKQKSEGPPRKLVGIEMIERGIPRSHYPVFVEDRKVGEVTSGTHSPTLKKNVGLALIDAKYASLGNVLEVEIRGKRVKAKMIKAPFYKRDAELHT